MEKDKRQSNMASRRTFIANTTALTSAILLGGITPAKAEIFKNTKLTDISTLPYPMNALQPYLGPETLRLHFHEHHRNYMRGLELAVENSKFKDMSLEQMIRGTVSNIDDRKIYDNAVLSWNHAFYWHSMKPKGGGEPGPKAKELINRGFTSFALFRKGFVKTGVDGGARP